MSAFSTWEKELHKIVFDPRYLLLNPEERKQVSERCPGPALSAANTSHTARDPGAAVSGG